MAGQRHFVKTHFFILAFLWTFVFWHCDSKKSNDTKTLTPPVSEDTLPSKAQSILPSGIPDFTTGQSFQPDTEELKYKRASILKKFSITNSPAGP